MLNALIQPDIIDHPSPNYGDRPDGASIDLLLIHYTGMKNGAEALARLCDPDAAVSAHYLVEEDGRIFQLVQDSDRAWHAGVGAWHKSNNINDISIGIEVVNPGHEFGYRPFPDKQITALTALSQWLVTRYFIPAERVLGHSDIAPGRKMDPGELFPWDKLSAAGVGCSLKDPYNDTSAYLQFGDCGEQVISLHELLIEIGYKLASTTHYGSETLDAIVAFQQHWRQSAVTGKVDLGTYQALKALKTMMIEGR